MSSQSIMSSKKANNNPGLCPIKGQKSGLCSQTRARRFCQMLVIHPEFYLLIFCLETPKDGSGPANFGTEPSLASLLVISFPHSPAYPENQYNPTVCWVEISFNAFWHSYQWRHCFGGLKGYQSCLAVRAYTHIFLWSTIPLNFIRTCHDSIYQSDKLQHTFLEKYWAFFPPIVHRLQPRSPPSWTHL
jgi:hypothetical protein